MGKRTNSAYWDGKRWNIKVQRDGVRKAFYSSTPGRRGRDEANSKADMWLDEGISCDNVKVRDIYDEWIENKKSVTSMSNWKPIISRWNTWVDPTIGRKKIQKLTEQDLQDCLNMACSAGKSKKTISSISSDIKSFLRFCRKKGITSFVPEFVEIPKSARYKGKRILQPDELAILFSVDTTIHYGVKKRDDYINAYRFQVLTGIRPGELVGLKWEDIDGNVIRIRRSINVLNEETKGKNNNALRMFCLPKLAMDVLDDQREYTGRDEYVFPILSEQTYRRNLRRYCLANDITEITPYEIRHTFVSAVKTLSEGEIRPIVGHSVDMDTFGIYGHALKGEREHTAQNLNAVFLNLLKSNATKVQK